MTDGDFPVTQGTEDVMDLVEETMPDENKVAEVKDETIVDDTKATAGTDGTVLDGSDIPDDLGAEPVKTEEANEDTGKPEEETEEPEGLTEDASTAFRTMRETIATLKKAQADSSTDSTVADLQAQLEAVQAKVSVTDLAASPAFQAKYGEPVAEKQAEIVGIAKEYGIPEDIALRAANMNRTDRISTLRNEASDQMAVSELVPLYQQLEARIKEGKDALAVHDKTRQEILNTENASVESLQGESFDTALTSLQADHFLLRDSKTNPDWLKAITHNAKLVLSGKVEKEAIIASALKAQVADSYKKMYTNLKASSDAKIADLESRYGKVKRSSPKVGGSAKPAAKDKTVEFKTIEELTASTKVG